MIPAEHIQAHDAGLPEPAIRKRRRSRRFAYIFLAIAALTAALGWPLFGQSVIAAVKIRDQPFSLVFIAYALLIISSITLVLGFWYLLLAQVECLAHVVEIEQFADGQSQRRCPNCGWLADPPDRFCRHCGKPVSSGPAVPDSP